MEFKDSLFYCPFLFEDFLLCKIVPLLLHNDDDDDDGDDDDDCGQMSVVLGLWWWVSLTSDRSLSCSTPIIHLMSFADHGDDDDYDDNKDCDGDDCDDDDDNDYRTGPYLHSTPCR